MDENQPYHVHLMMDVLLATLQYMRQMIHTVIRTVFYYILIHDKFLINPMTDHVVLNADVVTLFTKRHPAKKRMVLAMKNKELVVVKFFITVLKTNKLAYKAI